MFLSKWENICGLFYLYQINDYIILYNIMENTLNKSQAILKHKVKNIKFQNQSFSNYIIDFIKFIQIFYWYCDFCKEKLDYDFIFIILNMDNLI